MESELPCARKASAERMPVMFLGDDATSADQLALAVVELLGKKVITTDAEFLSPSSPSSDDGSVRVINSGTRALSRAKADARNRFLAHRVFSQAGTLPSLQIDSRLRGIGNALRGMYESLDFDFLLLVPAEHELGRVIHNGIFCHVEDGRLIPFHQSLLANPAETPLPTSDLRGFVATELEVPAERVVSIHGSVVSGDSDAIVDFIRGLRRHEKLILIPDVTQTGHFEAVVLAMKKLEPARILIAGSRTFLRSYLVSFGTRSAGIQLSQSLSSAIDRHKKGAPLAVISSLEPAMNSQIEYARRALGPNLVTVEFDSIAVLTDDQGIGREIDRVQQLVVQSLKAARPVLLQTSRTPGFSDAAVRQKHVEAVSKVVADARIHRHLTALLVSGGQTVEAIKRTLAVSAVEIKGAFQAGIPWGAPLAGPLKGIPLVTKGGRMGGENVLFEFLEQGHPLPRANILPVVTPLSNEKEVDEQGIERLIAHLFRLGATDIFAVGNAGEFRFLTNERRLKVIELFARKAQGRLRVFAGITGDTADETRGNYEAACRLGVHAAVVMPLYFLKTSEEIPSFVESLEPIQPKLPLILYNNPERTRGQNIASEAVEGLHFPVVAIKDSSGDLDRFDRYARSMAVYQGQQRQLLEGYRHGARGSVAIIGHVSALPNEFFAPATTAARREEIAAHINELSKTVKQGGAEVAAYKFVLSLMGVIGATVASNEPSRELTGDQRGRIRAGNAELICKMCL